MGLFAAGGRHAVASCPIVAVVGLTHTKTIAPALQLNRLSSHRDPMPQPTPLLRTVRAAFSSSSSVTLRYPLDL